MSVGTWKEVVFNPGEGVDEDDFNNAQRFARAFALDAIVRSLASMGLGFEQSSEVLSVARCYALGGGGQPIPTSTALQVTCTPGTILQALSNDPDGNAPQLLAYHLASSEIQATLAAGDASHDRIDLIQVKLEDVLPAADTDPTSTVLDGEEIRDFEDANTLQKTSQKFQKRRWTKLTWSVKAGTPAATPVRPTPDSGYVALFSVLVPATYNAVFTEAHIQDLRFPAMNPRTVYCAGGELQIIFGFSAQVDGTLKSAAANDKCLLIPRSSRAAGRLIAADWRAVAGGGNPISVSLVRIDWASGGMVGGVTALKTLASRTDGQEYGVLGDTPIWSSGFTSPANWNELAQPCADTILALEFVAGQADDVISFASMEFME